jgi:hypothetical protein
MKKILYIFVLCGLIAANLFATEYNKKLSFETNVFLKEYKYSANNNSLQANASNQHYFFYNQNGIEFTKVFLQINNNYSAETLANIGCKELVRTKSIALISIPINQIEALSQIPFVEKIEMATQVYPLLDSSINFTNVSKVHQGEDLEQCYFGDSVIFGIVDYGFDFTNPMFLDESGTCRVKRA